MRYRADDVPSLARKHPEVALIPIDMSPPVAFMVERAIANAAAFGPDARR
jgi:hypothetical protein